MLERFTMPVAVHLFLIRDNKILLSRRCNTGFADGCYSVVAGHVDGNETVYGAMQREATEEANISIDMDQLHIIQVMQRKCLDQERIDYFFHCTEYTGDIANNEPDKCDDLSWFSIDHLPVNMVGYVKSAIDNYLNHASFTLFGW